MNRTITCLFVSLLFIGFINANPVDKKVAKDVAIKFYKHNAPTEILNFSIKESFKTNYKSLTSYYTFVFEAGGFVMVSADDVIIPILGYSYKGELVKGNNNPTAEYWFNSYNENINKIIKSNIDNNETINEWNRIINETFMRNERSVDPLITTTWGQSGTYNDYCPSGVPTGCVATAIAQIMNYHEFPENGASWHLYNHSTYGMQMADFSTSEYDWENMPNTSGSDAVAWLMYHCGVSVDMNYDPSGSGAPGENVTYALANYFKYDQSINYVYASDYTTYDWKLLLKGNLDDGLPVFYGGSGELGGHAFVCDGYDNNDLFHFNWGWDGCQDGYFAIGSLNPGGISFNNSNSAAINIKPSVEGDEDFLWVKKFSGFPNESTAASYISVVDSNVAWTIGRDGTGSGVRYRTFTRTTTGGSIWSGSNVHDYGTAFSMIYGVSATTAYIAVWGTGIDNHIIKTTDGGENWNSILTGSGSDSFLNVGQFFDENNGVVQGDPVNGDYELYTTVNGGLDWTRIEGASIPDPEDASEYGITGLYDAVADTIWYTTNNGYIYKSEDKGYTWNKYQILSVTSTANIDVAFSADAQHGLAIVFVGDSREKFVTDDGGETWDPLNATGNFYYNDVCAIPGTANSFVSVGANFQTPFMGISYSIDGGQTWTDYSDYYKNSQFISIAMVSETKGFAGAFCGEFSKGMWMLGEAESTVIPDFEVSETDVCLNEEVIFTNISIGDADSIRWHFGDGAVPLTATGSGPHIVYYTTAGNKTLSLTAYMEGESITETKNDYISVSIIPEANFTYEFDDENIYLVSFINLSTNTNELTTYKWSFEDNAQSFMENPTYIFNNTGSYDVKLTVYNSYYCFDDTTITVNINNVSVSNLESNNHISIYPIPATSQVTIYSLVKSRIEIFNITGQKILSFVTENKTEHIDVSQFEKGVYLIKIENSENSITKKLIIE